jgi:hypothetical protein
MTGSLAERLVSVEIAAARIEAILLADPTLGLLWRAQAGLGEAVRSVALEDVRISEADLFLRLSEGSAVEVDARGAETAATVLRLLRNPRDILGEPVETVRGLEAALSPPRLDGAGEPDPEEEALRVEDAEIREAVAASLARPATPVLSALRAAAAYGAMTGRRAPMVERMIFVFAEGALRRVGEVPIIEGPREPGLDLEDFRGISAPWVALPASALVRQGFRLWSPLRPEGVSDLLERMDVSLSWELGQVGAIRHWLIRARREATGAKGRSRRADLLALAAREPLLSSGRVMEAIGVSRRTALTLLEDCRERGLLRLATGRGRWRLWAAAPFAERLGPATLRVRGTPASRREALSPPASGIPPAEPAARPDPERAARLREEGRRAVEEAGDALARAMAEADAILGRWPKRS